VGTVVEIGVRFPAILQHPVLPKYLLTRSSLGYIIHTSYKEVWQSGLLRQS